MDGNELITLGNTKLLALINTVQKSRKALEDSDVTLGIAADLFEHASRNALPFVLQWFNKKYLIPKSDTKQSWMQINNLIAEELGLSLGELTDSSQVIKTISEISSKQEELSVKNILLALWIEQSSDGELLPELALSYAKEFSFSTYDQIEWNLLHELSRMEVDNLFTFFVNALLLAKMSEEDNGEVSSLVGDTLRRLTAYNAFVLNSERFSSPQNEAESKLAFANSVKNMLGYIQRVTEYTGEALPIEITEVTARTMQQLARAAISLQIKDGLSTKEYIETGHFLMSRIWGILESASKNKGDMDNEDTVIRIAGPAIAAMARRYPDGSEQDFYRNIAQLGEPMIITFVLHIMNKYMLADKSSHTAAHEIWMSEHGQDPVVIEA